VSNIPENKVLVKLDSEKKKRASLKYLGINLVVLLWPSQNLVCESLFLFVVTLYYNTYHFTMSITSSF